MLCVLYTFTQVYNLFSNFLTKFSKTTRYALSVAHKVKKHWLWLWYAAHARLPSAYCMRQIVESNCAASSCTRYLSFSFDFRCFGLARCCRCAATIATTAPLPTLLLVLLPLLLRRALQWLLVYLFVAVLLLLC